MDHRKWRFAALLMATAILAQLLFVPNRADALGQPGQIIKVTRNTYNVRSGPGTQHAIYGQVVANSYFTVLGVEMSGSTAWYKIPYRGTEAYLSSNSSHIVMDTNGPFVANVPQQTNITDQAFEKTLAGFPDSYKPALRALHTKYPNWRFEPAPVADTFDQAVNKQYEDPRRNTVSYYDNHQWHWPYLYMVRNWNLVDGSSHYPVNRTGLAYFMDPRNFLTERDIFQFEKLTYSPNQHTLSSVRAVAGSNPALLGLAESFLEAARITNVSPMFLMSRARQEISEENGATGIINSARGDIDLAWPPLFGGDTSISFLEPVQQLEQLNRYRTSGRVFNAEQSQAYDDLNNYFRWQVLEQKLNDTKNLTEAEKIEIELYRATQPLPIATPVQRYYNLFNIGATPAVGVVDGNRINGIIYASGHRRVDNQLIPLDSTLIERYDLPWTSPEKAAIGGAKFIGRGYILAGQDTLYHQKFNVNGEIWHQYMSNTTAPYSEGQATYNGYQRMGLLGQSHVFKIPVFSDMPASTAQPNVVSLNISNNPNEEPGSEMQLVDPDIVETEPIETPQVPLDPEGKPVRHGDINGDGYINAADRLMITRHILKSHPLEGTAKDYADVNRDGYANAADRLMITRHILGTNRLQ